ncbi:MAG: pantoate--beta-alanine ligase [Candidatus Marinimicrobia bacterium]|nr:pantoate--beta-alanine ligase [Candidatus Neomarinimicrobiota bacterium]
MSRLEVLRDPAVMQTRALAWRRAGRRIGLVPTMGYLHPGHISLVRLAREQADVVVVSIFVNPTQFGPREDFATYPRDFARDLELLGAEGAITVFAPEAAAVYAPDASVQVCEERLASCLCGATRPGHFRGVLTVCAKLFHLALPDVAAFGRKDAQQLRLIEQMVRDLNFPLAILPGPIVREPDGLAMSSRNVRLPAAHRAQATCLHRALRTIEQAAARGERRTAALEALLRATIATAPDARLEYAELRDWHTLAPAPAQWHAPTLAALAVHFGDVRLIDNTLLTAS